MKITPKPIINSDKISKSRDVSGVRKWSQDSRAVGFIMLILGWFTIPAEVFLRRNFGRRWFTASNFFVGGILIFTMAFLQNLYDKVRYFFFNSNYSWNPFYSEEPPSVNYQGTAEFGIFLWAYLILGTYHLCRIWWRNRTHVEIHSYDDGTSNLEFVGSLIGALINVLAAPIIKGYMLFSLSTEEREGLTPPKLITDLDAFINTVFEPLLILILAMYDPYAILSLWLYMTSFAVAVHAHWKESAKRSKILDFKDSIIEAKVMMELKKGIQNVKAQPAASPHAAKPTKNDVQPTSNTTPLYPDLGTIIEEMNRERYYPLSSVVASLKGKR